MVSDWSARTSLCQLLSLVAIVLKGVIKSTKLLKGIWISKDNIARISGILHIG